MTLPFAQPFWIFTGIIIWTLVLIWMRMSAGKRRQALAEFAAPEITGRLTQNVSNVRRRIKDILLLVALFCSFLALARPQYGDEWIEVRQKGIDILIAVDTSRSMLARDIQPNRLERAKLAIKDFVDQLEGDRIGLMPFAGTSFLMCPLTTDYPAFTGSLDTLDPDSIPLGGTDIAGVITAAGKILANEANHKILILVTDGEDLEGAALQASQEAAEQDMTIYTIGVGTAEGELVPNMEDGGQTFIKDKADNFVRSKLDAITLTKIAETSGGLYVPLGNMGQGFATIYQQKLQLVPKEEHHERMQRHPIERFYWPLALTIVLLTLEFLLSGRKSSRSFGIPLIKTAGRRLFNHGKLLIVFLLLLSSLPENVNGSTGNEFYHAEKFDQAEQAYAKALEKEPDNAILHFNLGDAQYKKDDYEKAITSYSRVLQSDDLGLQAKGYYNLGNARYRLGQTTLKTDPEHTIELYQQALEAYDGNLALTPDDTDAAFNRDLVQKQLNELEKQQQEKQEQEQEQESQQNDEDQEKEDQDDGDKESQSQQNSDQESDGVQEKEKEKQSQEQENQADNGEPSEEKKDSENATDKDNPADNQDNGSAEDSGKEKEQTPQQADRDSTEGKGANRTGGMSTEDRERRQQGKMTLQEARNLLDALENEEGRLDFIPQGTGSNQDDPVKNW